MKKYKDVLKKYNIKPKKYKKIGNISVIDTDNGSFVIKKKENLKKVYDYLDSRSFIYYPNVIDKNYDEYEISEYIDGIDIPEEQKMIDIIRLVSLLHNKTTYYKEVSEEYYEKIYEDIRNNIIHLRSYYMDLISNIETNIYMSPSEYYLARNISEIFNCLDYSEELIEDWYKIVKDSNKVRYVLLHNNLDLEHYIRSDKSYLISWDKAKIDMPLFDIYKLYKRCNKDFDFESLLRDYESNYPLRKEERMLLFVLIALPDKIELEDNIYSMCEKINDLYDSIFRTEKLILNYRKKEEKQENH